MSDLKRLQAIDLYERERGGRAMVEVNSWVGSIALVAVFAAGFVIRGFIDEWKYEIKRTRHLTESKRTRKEGK